MKKYVYILVLMLLATMPVAAQTDGEQDFGSSRAKSGPHYLDFTVESFTYKYQSYDGKKNTIRLSAKAYYEWTLNTIRIKKILLSCHPTVTNNSSTPTGGDPVDGAINLMAGENANDDGFTLVVCPDYCGYGISSHLQHPYLIHDVTARNCVDAVVAAIDEAKLHGIEFADNYITDIVGYSQGGATALACAKYLESNACPQEIKDKVRLRQTTCGDGPYSTWATVNQYMEWGNPGPDGKGGENLAYPCVLPLIVAAAKDAYGEGCMRTVRVEDYFEPKFLQDTKIMDYLRTKSVNTEELNKVIKDKMPQFRRPVDIFSSNIINKTTGEFKTKTNEFKCLKRALQMADLTKGWTPQHDIFFYHFNCDKVVPYVNFEEITADDNSIGKLSPSKVHEVNIKEAHDDADYLPKFSKNLLNPDYNNIDHATGGIYFYVDYMFSSKLRNK